MVSVNRFCRQILCNSKHWQFQKSTQRQYSQASQLKVVLCGAASVIGQPLSLMLKQSPYIDELGLYDFQETCGVGLELQHIDTKCNIVAYNQSDAPGALKGAHVVIVLAGSPMTTRCDMHRAFDRSAIVVKEMVQNAAQYCPKALLAIAASPLEGMVPLAAEIFKLKGVYNRNTIFGVSTLNVIRANTFTAEAIDVDPECVVVPIIGGNTGDLIVPVLTEAKPFNDFNEQEVECITSALHKAQETIIKMKTSEAAVLSSSFAIARFVVSMIKGLKGQPEIVESSFVRTDAHPSLRYMNIPVILGPGGIKKDLGLPSMSSYERCILEGSFPILIDFEDRARDFLGIKKKQPCDRCEPSYKAPFCPEDFCEQRARGKQTGD